MQVQIPDRWDTGRSVIIETDRREVGVSIRGRIVDILYLSEYYDLKV